MVRRGRPRRRASVFDELVNFRITLMMLPSCAIREPWMASNPQGQRSRRQRGGRRHVNYSHVVLRRSYGGMALLVDSGSKVTAGRKRNGKFGGRRSPPRAPSGDALRVRAIGATIRLGCSLLTPSSNDQAAALRSGWLPASINDNRSHFLYAVWLCPATCVLSRVTIRDMRGLGFLGHSSCDGSRPAPKTAASNYAYARVSSTDPGLRIYCCGCGRFCQSIPTTSPRPWPRPRRTTTRSARTAASQVGVTDRAAHDHDAGLEPAVQ